MKFKFQSFVDVSTSATSMQILQWSVGGDEVLQRCRHLFPAYKFFKLGKISVKMVPASTLPVDPQGLSYDLDDPQTVDPRDQMNPGLVRITNGEDIFTDVASLSDAQQVNVYNAMMLDPRWSKFMLQSGFRRSAYPLFWQVGQLHQDKFPGTTLNIPLSSDGIVSGVVAKHAYSSSSGDTSTAIGPTRVEVGSSARGLFQVGHRGKLGFLPTDYYQMVANAGSSSASRYFESMGINNIPEVQVITCVLPKAYKTLYYYRIFITEEVIFSGLRSAPLLVEGAGAFGTPGVYYGVDQFIGNVPVAVKPGTPQTMLTLPPRNNGDELP